MAGSPAAPDPDLVSLVMAAWKPRPDWLRAAVHSALAQRGCRFELIVVDDGSPEPVAELLSDLDDRRLRVVRVAHGGSSPARNAGLELARGGLVRFVDCDDLVPPDSTALLTELIGGRQDVIAYGATLFCDEEMRPLWKMVSSVQGDAVEACVLGKFSVRPHALLFPRAVTDATGPWGTGSAGISHDWDYILRALEHAEVRGTRRVVSYYRRHGESVTADPDAGLTGARKVFEAYLTRHPERVGSPFERRLRAHEQAIAGRILLTHGRRRAGARALLGATRRDPRAVLSQLRLGAQFGVSRAITALTAGRRGGIAVAD